MKVFATILTGAAALLLAPGAALAKEKQDAAPTKGEVRLHEMLEGRVAGEPVRCIRQFANDRMTVIDKTAIVFGRGSKIYVNYTKHPDRIDDSDVIVFRKFGSSTRLCRLDDVSTVDRYNGFYTGQIYLTDFIPYTRDKTAQKDED